MDKQAEAALLRLGREEAENIAGREAIEDVAVVTDADSAYRPVYRFSFLLDQSRSEQRLGLVRLRLAQALHERLIAMGDEHYPTIQLLDRTDWVKRPGA